MACFFSVGQGYIRSVVLGHVEVVSSAESTLGLEP